MFGYHTHSSYGLQWRSGYRPGCSPEERNAAAYARRKSRAQWVQDNPGMSPCRHCGAPVPTAQIVHLCPPCHHAAEERSNQHAANVEYARKMRLRHGKGVIVEG